MNQLADYREILKEQYVDRRRLNPQYSLRAFARDLKLSPGRLSKVLHGKQGLSEASAKEVCAKLGMSPHETQYFCELVKFNDSRSKQGRDLARQALVTKYEDEQFRLLREDEFQMVSDWYHMVLQDLVGTSDFKSDPHWIAKRLGISLVEAEMAIERLIRLGLIKRVGKKLVLSDKPFRTTTDVPSQSLRHFHRQILNKAILALNEQSVEERDITVLTLPLDVAHLPEIKKKLKELRRGVLAAEKKLQKANSKRNEVYCLSIQFFRMTKKESEK